MAMQLTQLLRSRAGSIHIVPTSALTQQITHNMLNKLTTRMY